MKPKAMRNIKKKINQSAPSNIVNNNGDNTNTDEQIKPVSKWQRISLVKSKLNNRLRKPDIGYIQLLLYLAVLVIIAFIVIIIVIMTVILSVALLIETPPESLMNRKDDRVLLIRILSEDPLFIQYRSYKDKEDLLCHNGFPAYCKKPINSKCINVPKTLRFDCHPENGANELLCYDRGCCWQAIDELSDRKSQSSVPLNIPYCFYPSDWSLYEYENITGSMNKVAYLKNKNSSFYKNDMPIIKMEFISINPTTLQVKIYDPTKPRYEPILPIRRKREPNTMKSKFYDFEIDKHKPGFRITRQNTNKTIIFDSISAGGFIFADQFLQMSTLLPSHNIYGLGEHRSNLKLSTNWQSFTIFNRDQAPTENANLYGSHPFYMVMEETGDCHGVLFMNSNAMDVILQPTPALTFRTIGGIFDIYIFLGPTPEFVLRKFNELIGRPMLPPYWSFGFHLCRYGYGSLAKTREVWNRTRAAGIPFDTQWNDLDYMENNNDFTYNKATFADLPKFIDELHAVGMHYIPLIDPGISASEKQGTYPPYDEGMKYDIFVKDSDTNGPFIGKVWNRVSTVWPDFTHPKIEDYWYTMLSSMYKEFQYDGAWIDMNEPSNFYDGRLNGCSSNSTLDYPVYVPNVVGGTLAAKTLCMNAKHSLGWHYDIHNTYGMAEAAVTFSVLEKIRQKRPFIVSRATWVGQGHYSAHWTGDIYSSWYDLKMSIPEILRFSMYHIPMVGADICGFNGNTTVALCNRWMQVGAFYPFSRNHNSDENIEQDPVALGDIVVKSSRKALMIRYRFLPYLYTLFYRAYALGETVARPLFFEFPYDRNTWNIDSQFLWGKSFLIVPVLEENKEEVTAYLPSGLWYNFYDKSWINSCGENFTLAAPIDTIPILIRGGFIIPAQKPGKTTTESRKNDMELLIAPDIYGEATGELFWDDGETLVTTKYRWIRFHLRNQTLRVEELAPYKYTADIILGKVQIMGIQMDVMKVMLNGKTVNFNYDKKRSYLTITPINVNLNKDSFTLSWM